MRKQVFGHRIKPENINPEYLTDGEEIKLENGDVVRAIFINHVMDLNVEERKGVFTCRLIDGPECYFNKPCDQNMKISCISQQDYGYFFVTEEEFEKMKLEGKWPIRFNIP